MYAFGNVIFIAQRNSVCHPS